MGNQRIDCEQALRQLFDYIDRELGARDEAAIEQHLHTCKSCMSRFEFERMLKDKLAQLRDERASTQVTNRIRSLLRDL